MKEDKIVRYSDSLKILENGNRVIMGNSHTGEWIKISKECYEIVKTSIAKNHTIREFKERFNNQEDSTYMMRLLEQLLKSELITQETEKESIPKFITFAITERCNLNCIHCCIDANSHREELSFEECKNIMDQLVSLKPEQIIITGGEPMIRNDFLPLLRYLNSIYTGKIGLMTNGTLMNNSNTVELIKMVDSIDISLDGVDEETCSQIRGVGVFDKVIESVHKLQALGFGKISLSMVTTKKNQEFIEEFMELNKKLDTKPMLRSFSPMGRGEENREELQVEKRSVENQKKLGSKTGDSDLKICSCSALRKNLYIDYKGELFPCPVLLDKEYSFGKVLEKANLLEYFQTRANEKEDSYETFQSIYPQNYHECKDCNVNLFCWSCLHHVDLLKKGIISKGLACSERKKQLQDIVWGNEGNSLC